MENLTDKELQDYYTLFCEITDSYNPEEKIWEEEDLMVFRDSMYFVNVWRRLLIVLYILMSKKGIVPEISYASDEVLAYTNKYDEKRRVHENRLFYVTDDSYSKIYTFLLEMYGWEQPVDYTWGYYQNCKDLEKNEKLCAYVHQVFRDLFDEDVDSLIYESEISYSDLWEEIPPDLEKFFEEYGEISVNEICTLPEEQQDRLEEIFHDFVISRHIDGMVEMYGEAYCMTAFHNPKLDKVHSIKASLGDGSLEPAAQEQMESEYVNIETLAWNLVKSFYYSPIIENLILEGGKRIFTCVYPFRTSDYYHYDYMDMFVLAQPYMIFAIPMIDRAMDAFINKWGK